MKMNLTNSNKEITPGKGILAQIEDEAPVYTYRRLNLGDVKEFFLEHDLAALRGSLRIEIQYLVEANAIDAKQANGLLEMIESKDIESVNLAQQLIAIKSIELITNTNNGTNIQSKNTQV